MISLFVEMNQVYNWVGIGLLVIAGGLIIFDIWLYLNDTSGDTISNILRDWVYDRFFFITYFWGVLAGHFFLGYNDPLVSSNEYGLLIVVSTSLVLLIIGLKSKKPVTPLVQAILFVCGVAVGHFFWSLNH